MCKLSENIGPNEYNSMQSSFLSPAWPWSGRLLPKGNQWECWDPGLGPNVVRLPVHLPPLMPLTPLHYLPPPDAPTSLLAPNAPNDHLSPYTPCQSPDTLCQPLTSLHPCWPPDTPYTTATPNAP